MDVKNEMPSGGLWITRRVDEGFTMYIGDVEVWISVREINRGQTRIQIIAPKEKVTVIRHEQLEER